MHTCHAKQMDRIGPNLEQGGLGSTNCWTRHGSPGRCHPWGQEPLTRNVEVIFKKCKVPRVLNAKEMRCNSGIIINEKSTPKHHTGLSFQGGLG
jgi:hypothetical protein